jgi:hypothetical protein
MQIGKPVYHDFGVRLKELNTYLSNDIWNHINENVWTSAAPIWNSVNDSVWFNFEELGIWS